VEIVLLIGKSGVSQSADDSLSFINGFKVGIDLTEENEEKYYQNNRGEMVPLK